MSSNQAQEFLEQQKNIQIDEAELQRLNQEMVTSDLITPDRLYADLALFKDFNIGALASFHHERKATQDRDDRVAIYQSMLDALPAYRERSFDDVAHYFPRFAVSTAEVQARLRDPKWGPFILHHAPVTPYIALLHSQIAVNVNHSAVIGKRDPIELTINTYPLQLREMDRHIVGIYFSQVFKINVKVIYLDMTKLTLKDVLPYEEMYTYHFVELCSHEDIRQGYTELKFVRKRLYVPRLFGKTVDAVMNTTQQELTVKSRFDILTSFTFVPARLFSPVAPEEGKDEKKES